MSLFKRIQDWQDRRFLKRLERVMQNNVINAHLGVGGDISIYEKTDKGVPVLPLWRKKFDGTCETTEAFEADAVEINGIHIWYDKEKVCLMVSENKKHPAPKQDESENRIYELGKLESLSISR